MNILCNWLRERDSSAMCIMMESDEDDESFQLESSDESESDSEPEAGELDSEPGAGAQPMAVESAASANGDDSSVDDS